MLTFFCVFFFQAEDGIRDLVRSRGLGDVYKRQHIYRIEFLQLVGGTVNNVLEERPGEVKTPHDRVNPALACDLQCVLHGICLLYTSDAADVYSVSISVVAVSLKKKKKTTKWQ